MSALPDYEHDDGGVRHGILPSYDSSDAGPDLSSTLLPPSFKIGTAYTPPLVAPSEVHTHLLLLGAFHSLKEHVLAEPSPLDANMRKDVKWGVFLIRATVRFQTWVECVVGKRERRSGQMGELCDWEIPPLDVLLCFHAYLLNPWLFFHDCEALYPELRTIGPFPFSSLAYRIQQSLPSADSPSSSQSHQYTYTPTVSQIEEWELSTRLPFDPPLSTSFDCTVEVPCPRCGNVQEVPIITMLSGNGKNENEVETGVGKGTKETREGKGYAQRGFEATCTGCGLIITRGVLSCNNAAQDLARASNDINRGKKTFLNGNLLGPTGKVAYDTANHFPKFMFRSLESFDTPAVINKRIAYGNLFNWDLTNCQLMMENAMTKPQGPRPWHADFIKRSFRTYRQPHPFSLDLVGAIQRQYKFTSALHSLSYLSLDFLATHPSFIASSIIEYHLFLDVAKTHLSVLVPTLSIDLSWHTHMLKGDTYRLDCLRVMDRFLDHDDRVEEGVLATAYETTKQLWEAKHKSSYTKPVPPNISSPAFASPDRTSTLGIRLPFTSIPIFRRKPSSNASILPQSQGTISPNDVGVSTFQTPDHSSMLMSTSTPSVHNAALVLGDPFVEAKRKAREDKIIKRAMKEEKSVKKEQRKKWDPRGVGMDQRLNNPSIATDDLEEMVEGPQGTRAGSIPDITPSTVTDDKGTLGGTVVQFGRDARSSVFLNPILPEGVDAMSFASLGDSGWDIWGARDASLVDIREKRGDCCTGAPISCASITRTSTMAQPFIVGYG